MLQTLDLEQKKSKTEKKKECPQSGNWDQRE